MKESAIAEAITQFANQGVDLSELDTTGGIGRDDVLAAIHILKEYSKSDSSKNLLRFKSSLESLSLLITATNYLSKRNIHIIIDEGGWNCLLSILSSNKDIDTMITTTEFLTTLCKMEGDLFTHL